MSSDPSNGGSVLAAVGKYGAATVIALYLVYQGSNYLPAILKGTEENTKAIQQLQTDAVKRDERYEQIITLFGRQQTIMLYLMREVCSNGAKTETGRQRCNPRPDSDVWKDITPST